MRVAVGLGNPGVRYKNTLHNLGFRVVDLLAKEMGGNWKDGSTHLFCEVRCETLPLLLVKPMTYMNSSGFAVADVVERFGVPLEDVLVLVDDIHLELGRMRLRRRGSDGGHNGLVSVIETMGGSGFPRLRLGVGAPPDEIDLIDHVLSEFRAEEFERVETLVRAAADCVACWTALGLDVAMNRFNT
ncbi:MAG: aminoacyl-tRNA hydrolase [bacterium]|nr:aminoacyl-tRNA hydrolase [bacterium]